MPERLIDLHLHTNCSDGGYEPEEVVAMAEDAGLAAIAITDHDSLAAIDRAQQAAKEVELVTGVELSCQYQNADIHLLAYFVNHKYQPLAEKLSFYQQERLKRGQAIVQRLNEMGIDLHIDTVTRLAGDAAIGRAHVANALVKEEYVRSLDEAFSRYLGYHAPAYVPKTFFDPAHAIDLVHRAGGLAVMAHPATNRRDDAIAFFKSVGMDGIEVYHSKHTPTYVRRYKEMARKLNLLTTGGSDWHGRDDPRAEIGSQKVPYEVLELMKEYLAARRQ